MPICLPSPPTGGGVHWMGDLESSGARCGMQLGSFATRDLLNCPSLACLAGGPRLLCHEVVHPSTLVTLLSFCKSCWLSLLADPALLPNSPSFPSLEPANYRPELTLRLCLVTSCHCRTPVCRLCSADSTMPMVIVILQPRLFPKDR